MLILLLSLCSLLFAEGASVKRVDVTWGDGFRQTVTPPGETTQTVGDQFSHFGKKSISHVVKHGIEMDSFFSGVILYEDGTKRVYAGRHRIKEK